MSEINKTVCDRCGDEASKEGAKNWRHVQVTDGNGYGKTTEMDFCVQCWGFVASAMRYPKKNPRA